MVDMEAIEPASAIGAAAALLLQYPLDVLGCVHSSHEASLSLAVAPIDLSLLRIVAGPLSRSSLGGPPRLLAHRIFGVMILTTSLSNFFRVAQVMRPSDRPSSLWIGGVPSALLGSDFRTVLVFLTQIPRVDMIAVALLPSPQAQSLAFNADAVCDSPQRVAAPTRLLGYKIPRWILQSCAGGASPSSVLISVARS